MISSWHRSDITFRTDFLTYLQRKQWTEMLAEPLDVLNGEIVPRAQR
jgi:hypothetical protein